MAITIINSPSTFSWSFNPIYYVVSSGNSTKLNFKYILDITYSHDNSTYTSVGRTKIYPNPTDNYGYFDIHKILESYVYPSVNPTTTSVIHNSTGYVSVGLAFGEEYDNSLTISAATGTTTYSGLSITEGKILNGVFQFNETNSNLIYDIDNGGFDCKFLSSWNSSITKTMKRNGYQTDMIYTSNPAGDNILEIIYTFDWSGGSIGNYVLELSSMTQNRVEFPSGPKNLNVSSFNYQTSLTDTIINSNVYSYFIFLVKGSGGQSELYTYIIDDQCSRYDSLCILYLNKYGAYEYHTFELMKRDFIKNYKSTWNKKIGYGYTIGDRGTTINAINADKTFVVTSGWLDQHESDLLSEIFTSPSIYVLDSSFNKLPITLKTDTSEIKNLDNDFLINYTLEFEYVHKIYGQRG